MMRESKKINQIEQVSDQRQRFKHPRKLILERLFEDNRNVVKTTGKQRHIFFTKNKVFEDKRHNKRQVYV